MLASLGLLGCRPVAGPVTPGEPSTVVEADSGGAVEAEPVEVRMSSRYACMREGDGMVCWGAGVVLPDGETGRPEGLVSMPAVGFDQFAVGSDRICAVTDGQLSCWGHDVDVTPVLEDAGETGSIERVADLRATAVDIESDTVCALDHAKTLRCWTYEEPDDDEDYYDEEEEESPPWMEAHELEGEVAAFDTGVDFVCGILVGGSVRCWGADPVHEDVADKAWDECIEAEGDEDGDGDGCEEDEYDCEEYDEGDACEDEYDEALDEAWGEPLAIEGIPSPRAIASGSDTVCVLTDDGRVFCFGNGSSGQLGQGAAKSSMTPVAVRGIADAIAVDVGSNHACAVLEGGRVACWGSNDKMAVGGEQAQVSVPRLVPGITGAVDVELSGGLSCAIVRGGPPRCWGHDPQRRVRDRPTPTSIPAVAMKGATRLIPFGNDSCAARKDGSMMCWGRHELDAKLPMTSYARPRRAALTDLVEMIPLVPCGLTSVGELRCWRSVDQMHQGGATARILGDAVAVDAQKPVVCAAARDGQVHCWRHEKGKVPAPGPATSVGAAIDVAVGPKDGCAVRRDGAVDCWGLNARISVPARRLPGLSDAASITDANGEVCVRTTAGRVRCWKWTELDKPSYDPPVEGVDMLTSGTRHFCALARGQVQCWGHNGSGQLGVEDRKKTGPVRVLGLAGVVEIAAGDDHTCARDEEGEIRCWGRELEGQLGYVPSDYLVEPTPMWASTGDGSD